MLYVRSSRKRLAILLFLLLGFFLYNVSCLADNPVPAVGKTHSGDEFTLSDGHIVGLKGIKAPFPETEALADQSRATLEKLIGAWEPTLENISTDRYGRLAAQAFVTQADGGRVWLQEALLRAGMAFVYPPTGHEPNLDGMLRVEAEARAAEQGIWADPAYGDIPAAKTGEKYGRFAFVSGTVLKAERVKNKVYLNFGDDWRKDFTIVIAAHDLRTFRNAGVDPLGYKGKTVRVRGWVKRDFGPMITVTTPAQIQVTDAH